MSLPTSHKRDDIRVAVVALLAAAGTTAGARVHDHPYDPRTTFPCLVVSDGPEQQRAESMPFDEGRVIERSFQLMVTAEVQQSAGYAAARGRLLAEVEAVLAAARIPGVKSITPGAYVPDMDVLGAKPIALGHQRFDVLYFTPQGDPSTTL